MAGELKKRADRTRSPKVRENLYKIIERMWKYEELKREVELLRNSKLYKRLLEFEKNISFGKKFYRKDLEF